MPKTLVAGIDSSTQKTKIVIVDAETGGLVRSSAVPHRDGTEVPPEHWWSAFEGVGGTRAHDVAAMSVAAQQHTSIFLDERGASVRPAILWNDLRAAESGRQLQQERGAAYWLDSFGLLPDSAHPISKLRWLAEHEPASAARVAQVLLPHDWLTWKLLGAHAAPTTERSDASTTGYWSPLTESYDSGLITQALGHSLEVPTVVAADHVVGETTAGVPVAAGMGDNPATHMSLDTQYGDIVISVGTSTTVSMRTARPGHDASGFVDLMADARDGFIPLVAMLNGARVLGATAHMLGVGLDRLDEMAAHAVREPDSILLLPYLDGERNPLRGRSSGAFLGLSRHSLAPASMASAAILGLACAVADAVDALIEIHGAPSRIYLVGGGSRSSALWQAISDLTGHPVTRPSDREHAAAGAARQAAWSLTGEIPDWPKIVSSRDPAAGRDDWVPTVRARYRDAVARSAWPAIT